MVQVKLIESNGQKVELKTDGKVYTVTVSCDGTQNRTRVFTDYYEASRYFDGQFRGN